MQEYEITEEWNQIQANLVMSRNWNNFFYAKVQTQQKKNKLASTFTRICTSGPASLPLLYNSYDITQHIKTVMT